MGNNATAVRQSTFAGNLATLFRPSVVVGIIYVALIVLIAITKHYSVIDFVHLGTVWGEHNKAGTWGYDGQFYYQIARNPLGAYQYMDNASFRYQHILYGIVIGVLSLGQPVLIPYMMLLVNVLSVVITVEIVARLLEKHGFSPWFSLAIGLYFGQAAALLFDTAEPFTYVLVALGVWLVTKKHVAWAALLLGLACLSREIAVLFPAAYAFYYFVRRDWLACAKFVVLGIVPLLVLLLVLRLIFGQTGLTFTRPLEHIPFAGIFFYYQTLKKFLLLVLLMLLPTLAGWILAVVEIIRRKWSAFSVEMLFLLANLVLITFMSRFSYEDLVSSGRIATGLVLAVLLYGTVTQNKRVLWAAQFYTLTFAVYVIGTLLHIPSFLA